MHDDPHECVRPAVGRADGGGGVDFPAGRRLVTVAVPDTYRPVPRRDGVS